MSEKQKLENERDQQMRLSSVDMATRVVGKPNYFEIKGEMIKHQEDVVEVATRIYEFVKG